MKNTEIIEMIKDAAFFGGNIKRENYEECRNFFDEIIEKQLTLTDVSDTLILTPKDAQLFFNEIMNPKDANEALKKAMLKFITR